MKRVKGRIAIPIAVSYVTFSRHANGVLAINGSPAFAPTPLAWRLNVETSHSWPREVSLHCLVRAIAARFIGEGAFAVISGEAN